MKSLLFVLLANQPSNPFGMLIPFLLIIVVFYFFMIRPQSKRQKELKNFRESLRKGDKVITTGGIYGRIVEMEERTALLEIDNNVKIKVDKAAILKDPSDIESR